MSSRVYIGRLSNRATERDVEHFFKGYGKLKEVIIKQGFGFAVGGFVLSVKRERYFFITWLGCCNCENKSFLFRDILPVVLLLCVRSNALRVF